MGIDHAKKINKLFAPASVFVIEKTYGHVKIGHNKIKISQWMIVEFRLIMYE